MADSIEHHPESLLRFPTYALGKLHKALHAEIDSSLRDHWVLVYLEERAHISQQVISDVLEIDRSEVVRMIDSLEAAGLVTRTRDPHDRRRYQLTVTTKGRRKTQETEREIEAATDHVLRRLDPVERDTLARLARKALGLDAP